ncbi:MAG TPA: HAMP domain-containing sensor histidine kinase [Acidimicrobiales bacterium]|nr:HAMP domain-containing sensor histidine kinase [Acidimicrobiales bacterium]
MTRLAPPSLRNRISLVLVVSVTVVLAGANVIVFTLAVRFLDRRIDTQLDRQTEFIEGFLVPYSRSPQAPERQRVVADDEPSAGLYMAVVDPGGNLAFGLFIATGSDSAPPPIPTVLPDAPLETIDDDTTARVDGHAEPFRMRATGLDDGTVIVSAVQTTTTRSDLRLLMLALAATSVAILALVALLSRRLVGMGLRPLARMEAAAQRIADGDLGQRVAPSGPETEISRLGASLNRMLVEIEDAFTERQESEQRLRASQATLRRFAADASHELRTPLTSIQGYAQLLRRGRITDDAEAIRAAARIEDEGARLAALVDDLLLLAQLDEHAAPVHQPLDVRDIVASAVDDRRIIEPDRDIDYRAETPAMVEGDAHQLARVITNLLANACQHTPPGTPVEVVVGQGDDEVTVDLVDHGEGIAPEARAHLFDRFFRADSSRARATGGAGLGLAIVASIAEAHDGRCTVLDTPGGGATFRFALPTPDRHEPPPPAPEPREAADPAGARPAAAVEEARR